MARTLLPQELEALQEVLALVPERAVDHLISALQQGEVDGCSKDRSVLAILARGCDIRGDVSRPGEIVGYFCKVYDISREWQEAVLRYTASVRMGDRAVYNAPRSVIIHNLIEICEQDKTERRLMVA